MNIVNQPFSKTRTRPCYSFDDSYLCKMWTSLFLLLSPWMVGGCLFLLVTSLISWIYFCTPKPSANHPHRRPDKGKLEAIANLVSQTLPLHPNNGWKLKGTSESIRIFGRHLDSLQTQEDHSLDKEVFGASLVMDLTVKRTLSLVSSVRELPCWSACLPSQSSHILVNHKTPSSHLLQFTCRDTSKGSLQKWRKILHSRISSWMVKYLPFLERLVPTPQGIITEVLERHWKHGGDEEGTLSYLISCPRQFSSLPFWWSCLFFTPLPQPGVCLVTMVMLPQPKVDATPLISEQLCALREHITMRCFKVYKSFKQSHHNQEIKVQMGKEGVVKAGKEGVATGGDIGDIDASKKGVATGDDVTSLPMRLPVTPPPLSAEAVLDAKYLDRALECTNKLVAMTKEGPAEGWLEVGTKKNVHVMKKFPVEGGPVLNSVRGTGHIDVPPEFLLRVLRDPALSVKLDDMLREARVVHKISPAVVLVHLMYKPVWPTSPRDFAALSIAGQVDETTWISSGMSITDDRIPEEKGYVRGDLVSGGYIIQAVPGNHGASFVTYGACVDLKGNIPGFAVNKMAEMQPMCIDLLRKLSLSIYQEVKDDSQKMQRMKEQFPISWIDPDVMSDGGVASGVASDGGVASGVASDGGVASGVASDGGVASGVASDGGVASGVASDGGVASDDGVGVTNGDGGVASGVASDDGVGVTNGDGGFASGVGNGVPLQMHRLANTQWHFDPSSLHTEEPVTNSVVPSSLKKEDGVIPGGGGTDEEGYVTPILESEEELEGTSIEVKGHVPGCVVECDPPSPASVQLETPPSSSSLSAFNLALLPKYTHDGGVDDLETSMDPTSFSLTNETISYPRRDSGLVDYRTLANQTAARVLEEVFHVSNLDLSDPTTFCDQSGSWSFNGVEKEVLLLSKTNPDSNYTSFMGKGVIPLPPQFVFDSLRNPQLRFTYDNMLKELHIVRQIEDGLYILHLHHETTQCFIKQARDFCILVSERSEPNKKLLIGTSVETPECPPNPSLHRGKIYCSGWIVEPSHHISGKVGTQITYLLRVDMGGVPSSLMNYIGKRQPLAVAYLRDYLMSTSIDQTGN